MSLAGGMFVPPAGDYLFLLGRCVSADAAADLVALLDFGSRSTFDAAEAALALVTSEFFLPAITITSFPVDPATDSS